jgi:hypothetical protein
VRTQRRRSAAVVLWALGLLAAAHVAWSLLGETPALRDPEYGARLKHLQHRIRQAPDRPLVVGLGSSRLLTGLAADDLPPDRTTGPLFFNMGITAAGPVNELIMLRRLLRDGIRPRGMIVEVLPRSLCFYPGDPRIQETVSAQRRTWKDHDLLPAAEERLCFLDWLVPPWSDMRFGLMHYLAPGWVSTGKRLESYATTAHGWMPINDQPTVEQRARSLAQDHDEYAATLRFAAINAKADQVLHMLFDECRRNHIEVLALISMPESSEFRSWYGPGTRQALVSYLTGLCEEQGACYVNAAEWIADGCFFDGHHLLVRGAKAFTARLWREVLQPWAEKR